MPETHKLQKNMNTENEAKIVIESLKYNCKYNEFFELSNRGEYHYFRGEIIIKNKYLLVGIDNSILLFDIYSGKKLKKYEILIEEVDNLYKQNINIQKWNNQSDNEFFININGNIFLFRLTDENDIIIIATFYSKYVTNLIKLDENNNIFYDDGNDENYDYENNWSFESSDNENNKNNSVFIFY